MLRKSFYTIVLLLLFAGTGLSAASRDDSAEGWMERMHAALAPSSSTQARATLETRIGIDAGAVIRMKLSRHTDLAETRTLIELTEPEAARGAVYEVVDRGEQTLERWEYLPSIRRFRRISGIERGALFMGTDFSYQALTLVDSTEHARGHVDWVRDEGRSLVRVTSLPEPFVGRVVTLIEPVTALPVRISFYAESGELTGIQEFGSVETIQGHRVPTVIVMRDVQSGSTSTLSFEDIRFDVEVPSKLWERDEVQRTP